MIYCVARTPNAGLANKLFPWARAKIFSKKYNAPMLETTWSQFKLGPLLRGERDNRFYVGVFDKSQSEISGLRKAWISLTCRSVVGPEVLDENVDLQGNQLFCYSGWEPWFKGLVPWRAYIRSELLSIVNKKWRDKMSSFQGLPPLGIHMRLGDFMSTDAKKSRIGSGVRTPVGWFVDCLRKIRQELGYPIGAFVVTDGIYQEIRPLLDLGNVEWVDTTSAISDMLILSKAKLILGSGGSTFSAWGSYLSVDAPIVAMTGLGFHRQFLDNSYECDGGMVPVSVLKCLN